MQDQMKGLSAAELYWFREMVVSRIPECNKLRSVVVPRTLIIWPSAKVYSSAPFVSLQFWITFCYVLSARFKAQLVDKNTLYDIRAKSLSVNNLINDFSTCCSFSLEVYEVLIIEDGV